MPTGSSGGADRRRVRYQWGVLLFVMLLGGAGGVVVGVATPQAFTATARVYIRATFGSSGSDLNAGAQYTQETMVSYGLLALSSAVLHPVISQLGLHMTSDTLAEEIAVVNSTKSTVMEISDTNRSASVASSVANAVAASLTREIGAVAPTKAGGGAAMFAQTISPAPVPSTASAPKKTQDVELGLVVGLVVGASFASFGSFGRRGVGRLRGPSDVASATDAPFIGAVPRRAVPGRAGVRRAGVRRAGLIGHVQVVRPAGTAAESFRALAANFRFVSSFPVVAVVAAPAGDGGAAAGPGTVPGRARGRTHFATLDAALDLAVVLAEGHRVLVIDADLRRSQRALRSSSSIGGEPGLVTVVEGVADLADVVQATGDGSLDFLAAGVSTANPAMVLSSSAFRRVIARARQKYEIVLVCTSGVLGDADAITVATATDGVIVVADRRCAVSRLEAAQERLDRAGAVTLGVVLLRGPERADTGRFAAVRRGERAAASS